MITAYDRLLALFRITCMCQNVLWLFGRVEINGNANGRVHTVDTFARADVSVQNIVFQLIDVDGCSRGGCRAALPDLLKFVRHRYRFANSSLGRKHPDCHNHVPVQYR